MDLQKFNDLNIEKGDFLQLNIGSSKATIKGVLMFKNHSFIQIQMQKRCDTGFTKKIYIKDIFDIVNKGVYSCNTSSKGKKLKFKSGAKGGVSRVCTPYNKAQQRKAENRRVVAF